MTKFVPLNGLEKLSEEERKSYYLSACEFLGVPPELGLLEFIWLDGGDGARKYTLYVKKGATDIIRASRGISVTKLTKDIGDGYVAWIAEGVDKNGRTEIAVGSESTKNLSGKNLSNCVMTAQTKANRRLTLQFAGGGFMDESELTGSVTTDLSAAPSIAQVAQPSVSVNLDSGKDITEYKDYPNSKASLDDAINTLLIDPLVHKAAEELMPEIKRRGRKRTEEPGSKPFVMPETKLSLSAHNEDLALKEMEIQRDIAVNQIIDKVSSKIEEKLDTVSPTKEQEAEFKKKISKYRNDVLEPAGMVATEQHGSVVNQFRMFAKEIMGKETTVFSVSDWGKFFGVMDGKISSVGAKGLVDFIYETLGIE